MPTSLTRQLVEFGRTIRLSHTLFALPFALGTALVADPPCPDATSLALLLACMVAARTAGMGMNRVADAAIDARNPRTADRAIPAGRLSRRTTLAISLTSGAAFMALAWGFFVLQRNAWPGILAPAFLAILYGYSWTKRITALSHWVLGLCLGLAPVGVWIALRGEISLWPVLIGAAVMLWTAGFDILYALQDVEVDRRERLHSIPARWGRHVAVRLAAACHLLMWVLLALAVPQIMAFVDTLVEGRVGRSAVPAGWASLAALALIAGVLLAQHIRSRRTTPEQINAAFFRMNVLVSMIWLAGVAADVLILAR
jgi:4-hydroxybenzoate polyprenyltransferase